MSEYVVRLPDVGEGVAEAEIVEWHVAVGDTITEDDVLAAVMTDKATVELPSPVDGVVRWLGGEVGDVLAVGSDLVKIDTAADTPADTPADAVDEVDAVEPAPPAATADDDRAADDTAAEETAADDTGDTAPAPAAAAPAAGRKPTAAPAVRGRARRLGVDLASITGTGPEGRITHEDLDTVLTASARPPAAPAAPAAPAPPRPRRAPAPAGADDVETVKVTGLRRNIAERMQVAKRRIPHFTYVEEVDVTDVERLRAELNDGREPDQPRLTLLPLLMRAVVAAIRDHPGVNARYDDEAGVVHRHRAVHLGIAVQTERGLMVPVVKHAEELDIWTSAQEVARLSTAARNAKITLDELTGSTITITSLGSLGGIASTPVINAPEVGIVGVNKIAVRAVYTDGAFVPRQVMNLSSSFDHRIIDGADGAAFVQAVKRRLETPALLFVSDAPAT